jgi:hypothetical protein
MSEPPEKIDELLSGGRLGRPAQERVLGRVLDAIDAPARAARRKRTLAITFGAGSFAALAAAVLLFVGRSPSPSGAYLAAKGERPPAGAIEPVCESGTAACRTGERLFFRVFASESRRWLAIFAESADGATPGRIWMFPGPDGVALEIPPAPEPVVLPRAVELGAELRPGLYRLTILIFDHPPTREEASSGASASLRLFRALEIH